MSAIPTTGAVDSAITETFEFVFFEGLGGVSNEVPFPFPVSVAGRPFLLDLAHYAWQIPDMVRQAVDFSASPGEQCADEETEILTERGWLRHYDLAVGDVALTFNAETGLSEWQPVRKVFRYERKRRTMLSMEGRGHSSLTTLAHRWPVAHRADHGNAGCSWETRWKTSGTLNRSDNLVTAAECASLPAEPKYLDDFVELVAWFWTEGNVTLDHRRENVRRVTIAQHPGPNPQKVQRIRACMTRLFGAPGRSWYEYENPSNGCHLFHIRRGHFDELLATVDENKVVSPEFLTRLTRAQLELFIDVSIQADGTVRPDGNVMMTQAHQGRIDSYQMACVLAGRRTNRAYVRAKSSTAGWRWTCSASRGRPRLNPRYNVLQGTFKMDEVVHDGMVWCPSTDNGTWCARRKGHVYFTGNSFDTGGVWLRSDGDWSLGAGQSYHDAALSEQRLFHASRGVDVWTHRQLTLFPKCEVLAASLDQTLRLLPHGAYLYVMDGEAGTLKRCTNPQDQTPAFTPITGLAGTFVDLTTDGNLVYVAASGGIFSHDVSAGTVAAAYGGAASTTVATLLRFCDGWLLCGVGRTLSTIDAGGALTTVKAHPVLAFSWTAAVGAPNGIYVGGQGDDIAEIFHIGFDAATGGLAAPIHASELPRGETLQSLAYYGSSVMVGSSKGLRLGDIQSDGSLTLGALITTNAPVLCAFGEDRFVYFGWTNYDPTHTGIGRANLAEFRAKSQPAFATDLMADNVQGQTVSVCLFQGHTYFAVAGSGVWREMADHTLVETGVISMGKMEWGTFEPKTFLGLQLTTLPLVGQVSATLTDDAGVVTNIGTLLDIGTTGIGRLLGAGLGDLSTFYEVELTLHRPA